MTSADDNVDADHVTEGPGMATALTYRTSDRARDLRTVILDDVRHAVVMLPSGRLDIVLGKLLHGTTCAHAFWNEVLGTSGDDFVIPAAQVVHQRETTVAVKVKRHKQAPA
jgi:hypothetical protein